MAVNWFADRKTTFHHTKKQIPPLFKQFKQAVLSKTKPKNTTVSYCTDMYSDTQKCNESASKPRPTQ